LIFKQQETEKMNRITSGRRGFIRTAVSFAALAASAVQARTFPAKPLTLVVPFAPGGNVDIVARTLGIPLARHAGQSVIVDNRAGGGGAVGSGWVARAEPDGHTLLVATPGQLGTLPEMIRLPYRADSFAPIAVVSRTPVVVVVRANDARFRTAADFIKAMKARDGSVTVGHAGPGSPNHLAVLQLEDAVRQRVNPVPYKGSGPALVDLIGGQIDAVVDQITSSTPHIKSGAHVPDLAQLGLPVFDATTFVGVFAPRGAPTASVDSLYGWISKSVAEPEFSSLIRELGSEPFPASAAVLQRLVSDEAALAARLTRQGRLRAE
jgi:tripartite-type tricarboxylate transporter receptor subunit TctC